MAVNRKGETIRSAAREIIARVIDGCEEEAQNNALKIPLRSKTERAAFYTGVSGSSIKRIKKENLKRNLEDPGSSLSSPGKKRPRTTISQKVHDFEFRIIRETIDEFYLKRKIVPTCAKLLVAIREKIEFPYSSKSLNRLLKENGFYWRKCGSKRKILIERPAIVDWRLKYLRAIKRYQAEGRHIIYLDETWIDANMTVNKCWQGENVRGVTKNISSTSRLIVVHAGSVEGFVKNAELVFQAGTATGDYHGQMNRQNFEKWLREQLLPNIPPSSVLVFDNAPYHSEVINKTPTRSSTKSAMIEWLNQHNIAHDSSDRKADLMELIHRNKPLEKLYKIDEVVKQAGHVALRLPPYMCELNPIELAWASVKRYIRERNTSGNMSKNDMKTLTHEAIASVSKKDWEGYINHIRGIEDSFWARDGLIEDALDQFTINLRDESSDDESLFGTSSSEYYDNTDEEEPF